MKKSKVKIYFIVLISFGLIGFIMMVYSNREMLFQNEEEYFNSLIKSYSNYTFDGVVTKKYIDEPNHSLSKIVISSKYDPDFIFISDFEDICFYNFIQIGDSLKKDKPSLAIKLKRKDVDTTIFLRFKNVKGFDDFKLTDSIKMLYK